MKKLVKLVVVIVLLELLTVNIGAQTDEDEVQLTPTPIPTLTPMPTLITEPTPTVEEEEPTPLPTQVPDEEVDPEPTATPRPTLEPTRVPTPKPTMKPTPTATPTPIPAIGGDQIDPPESIQNVVEVIDQRVENVVDDISESNSQVQEAVETVAFEGILPSIEYFKNYNFQDFYKQERLPTNVTNVLLAVSALFLLTGVVIFNFEYIANFIKSGRFGPASV